MRMRFKNKSFNSAFLKYNTTYQILLENSRSISHLLCRFAFFLASMFKIDHQTIKEAARKQSFLIDLNNYVFMNLKTSLSK